MKVSIGSRFCGGVVMIDMSRILVSDMCRVRGIGVAVRVRQSMLVFSSLSRSLCLTPKRCSSSITSNPRFLNVTSFWISRWVPTTTSTPPPATAATTARCSCLLRNRDSISTCTGNAPKRSPKVSKCCSASIVVGVSTATCLPPITALNAARSATSVLPKPTSPHTSRSMGLGASMSALTSSMQRIWSSVSWYGNPASNCACQSVSVSKAVPCACLRRAYSRTRRSASSSTDLRTLALRASHALPPMRSSFGARPSLPT